MGILLFISVLLVAACGLIYELVAGTLASYLVGDSVFQFSTIIGTYLFAMGIGSALSRYINRGLVNRFVWIELLLGVIGGFSSALLMLAFAFTQGFELILYALVIVMGVLVGLEIPLLMRIVRDRYQFRDVIAHVLTFDYLGALGASLLFPILLVPRLGLVRSAMLFGLINAAVALWSTFLFANQLSRPRGLRVACAVVLCALGAGIAGAKHITATAEDNIYADEIIFARDTRYQHLVLTRFKDDLRLFLNSHLQFSSRDEYRYHEALVHPGLAAFPARACHQRRCLPLGRFERGQFRFHRHRFSRPHELFARQALHHRVLPRGRAPPQRAGIYGRTKHLANVRARFLLVRRANAEAIWPANLSIPRVRPLFRRMGLRPRRHTQIHSCHRAPRRIAFRQC